MTMKPDLHDLPDLHDVIQETVIRRAEEMELTAYAIAAQTGGMVSKDHVKNYLCRRSSMSSHKLQHILAVLALEVRRRPQPRPLR